ncbi:MAG: phage recombination protein Bet [Pseudomonadaceae bacterium]|nr:phage recombination protein Bet [Pseudomonadaceae bacterium]
MSTSVAVWQEQHPTLVSRGIDESTWNALKSTIYPGAKDDSIIMAVDYCRARKLDPMLKPVHLVPMQVTIKHEGREDTKEWRDVPMPGIGLYRIQADRSKTYAGADEPEYGPEITRTFTGYNNRQVEFTFPQWCKFVVRKLVGGMVVEYHAKEYWLENYASLARDKDAPNAMWSKRPYAQLAKCAEAQALRRAWPEIGSDPTAEEMMGKTLDADELRDVSPTPAKTTPAPRKAEETPEPVIPSGATVEGEFFEHEQEPQADSASSAPVDLIKPNHIKMITTRLARTSTPDGELLALLKVDCLESIPMSRLNDAMDYVNKLGK